MYMFIACLLVTLSENLFLSRGHIYNMTSSFYRISSSTEETMKYQRNTLPSSSTTQHETRWIQPQDMRNFITAETRTPVRLNIPNSSYDGLKSKINEKDSSHVIAVESDMENTHIQSSALYEKITFPLPTVTEESSKTFDFEPFSTDHIINGDSNSSPCTSDFVEGQFMANCTGLSLETLNSTWFQANLNIIHLDNNVLKEIDNFIFSHLHELRILTISGNKIHRINVNAFAGLNNLKTLNLEYNKLTLSEQSYPPGVFDPLINLQELYILNNDLHNYGETCYPDKFLRNIKKLKTLTIDMSCDTLCFGEGFRNLTNLSRLKMSGTSTSIDEYSFVNVKHVRELVLHTFEFLSNFSDTALESLKELQSLTLHNFRAGVTTSLLALKPLRGINMTSIFFKEIDVFAYDTYVSFIENDGVLNYQKTQFLLEICVESVSIVHSSIYVIQKDTFVSPVWDRCLRSLDLSANPIIGAKVSLIQIFSLKNLEAFVWNNGYDKFYDIMFHSGTVNTLLFTKTSNISKSSFQKVTYENIKQISDDYTISNTLKFTGNSLFNDNTYPVSTSVTDNLLRCTSPSSLIPGFIWFPVPQSLRRVEFRGNIGTTFLYYNVQFVNAKNLQYMDFSSNRLYQFQGNLTGLEFLQILIFSGNDMSSLSETFFDNFCRLENLYLANCILGADFMSRHSSRIFQNLARLQRLDLSLNLLNSLEYGTFQYNAGIKEIYLSKNRFTNIPFDLKNTPNLQHLDLRQNSITSFRRTERDGLDELANKPAGIIVLLDGNALLCDCNNLDFLYWLKTTHVQLDSSVNLTCTDSDGVTLNVSTFSDLEYLWRKCWGTFFLYFAVIIFLCMIVCFFTIFFVSKHHMWVKSAIIRLITGYIVKCPADYKIDVYIGYSEADYTFPCFELSKFIETELKLNTYVYHRDMLVWDMASSIVEAVNDSWRVILVFGNTFLRNDQWSMLTCRTAIYSQTLENPSKIIVLVDTNLQHRLPPEVLAAVNDDNIIVVPKWEITYDLREKLRIRLKQS